MAYPLYCGPFVRAAGNIPASVRGGVYFNFNSEGDFGFK